MSDRLQQNLPDRAQSLSGLCRAVFGIPLLLLLLTGQPSVASAKDKMPAKATATAGQSDSGKKDSSDSDSETKADDNPGFRLEKIKEIVLWNEHNGKRHDSGTQKCNLILSLDGKVVWQKDDVEIPWEASKSANLVIDIPNLKADKLRVEVTAWNEKSGGLAEIEVLDKSGTNLALGGKVKTSDQRSAGDPLGGTALLDGNFDSPNEEAGYWRLPDGKEGWAELELVPQPPPAKPHEPPVAKQGKKVLSRVAMPCQIYVTCDSSFELYINNVHVLSGHGQRCFSRDFKIANGDLIAAKCEGSSDTKGGFCCLIIFTNGHFLSTQSGWSSYTPGNPTTWFSGAGAQNKSLTPATKGTSGWAEKEMISELSKKAPHPQIWGTGKTVYLGLKADTKVKRVKMKPGQKPGQKR
jgi:hypothetical protein